MAEKHLAVWSATAVALVGAAYLVVLVIGIAVHGFSRPIVDPILAIMEVLTLVSAPAIVALAAAIHGYAAPTRKTHGLIALAFSTAFAGMTCSVHFVELTAARQLGPGSIVWPSAAYALELLAWDVFLGLALLFAAQVFRDEGPERAARRGLVLSGVLCLTGTVGPAVGNMRLQLAGVIGYGLVLPVVCVILARLFRRSAWPGHEDATASRLVRGVGPTGD